MDDGRRRTVVNAARVLMLVLAVGTGWGAVAAAGGTGHATDVEPAGPPAPWVAAAPPALVPGQDVPDPEADAAELARQDRSGSASRSRDRLDPRFPGCADAGAAGFGPYTEGQDVEYAWYPDADGDGVACP